MLVTGGSRGIGAAVAQLAARDGYAVAVNYKSNHSEAERVVELIMKEGGKAMLFKADVSDRKQVQKMFTEVDQSLGRIDALVNNAGILEKQSRLENLDEDRLRRIFSVNVFGAIFCAQEAAKRMSLSQG